MAWSYEDFEAFEYAAREDPTVFLKPITPKQTCECSDCPCQSEKRNHDDDSTLRSQ